MPPPIALFPQIIAGFNAIPEEIYEYEVHKFAAYPHLALVSQIERFLSVLTRPVYTDGTSTNIFAPHLDYHTTPAYRESGSFPLGACPRLVAVNIAVFSGDAECTPRLYWLMPRTIWGSL